MSANEDPAAPSNAEATGDKLEDWLSDLRTEVAADPTGWIGEQPADEHPAAPPAEPTRVGRHRAPEE